MRRWTAFGVFVLAIALKGAPGATPPRIDVSVHEGTSMSVGVSPDGRTLAVDLQGSIWTLPASGGTATRITDVFNDARQPTWSPDGKWITFFAYRDGVVARRQTPRDRRHRADDEALPRGDQPDPHDVVDVAER
jgi:dipeptidyl aminopeptidase/acylaminoacyl peptidase